MKRKLTLLSLAFLPASLFAQITLDQSSYTGWTPGVDTLREINGQVSLAVGPNQHWDLSTKNYIAGYYTNIYNSGTMAGLAGATFSNNISLSLAPGATYDAKSWHGMSSTGIFSPGMSMLHQNLDLSSVTSTPNDSLVFPTQTVVYSTPGTAIKFPATYGDTWGSSYRSVTDFNVTIASMFMNNAAGQRVSYVTQTDTVKGWGKMKVKDKAGNPSANMDVLQVKTMITQVDSFFLNGTAVPSSTLLGLGLSQGMTTEMYFMNYFRAGEVTPLVEVEYADGTYTNQAASYVHMNRLADPAGIEDIADDNGISIYPNPITNGAVKVNIVKNASGKWAYELINVTGQSIGSGNLTVNGAKANIQLPTATVPGTYFLKLYRNGEQMSVKTLSIN